MLEATTPSRVAPRIVEGCWLAALVAVPLVFDAQAARVFEPTKVGLLWSLALLALAATPFASRGSSWPRGARPVLFATLGFVAVVLLGTATSIAPRVSTLGSPRRVDGALTLLAYVVLFASVAVHVRRPAQVARLMDAVLLGGTLVALYAILQRLGLDPVGLAFDRRRVASTLALPPFLGAYVTLVVPLGLARSVAAYLRGDRGRAALYALAALALVAAGLFTQSRAALLGLLTATLLMGLVLLLSAPPRTPARRLGRVWVGAGVGLVALIAALNVTGTPLDPLLAPLRDSPWLERLARIAQTREGTGRVRVLIWDATLELVTRGTPIGVPGDELAGPDALHAVRPWLGYGQDTQLAAFAAVYPPEYAHYEARTALVDRCHNETLDRLVANGALGLIAWYLLIGALWARALGLLGWLNDRRARRRLALLLAGGGLLGAGVAALATGAPTFVPLGLPLGLVAGLFAHVLWEGVARRAVAEAPIEAGEPGARLLGAALLGALVGHFVQMQLGFSVAATSTCWWVQAGLLVALPRATAAGPERAPVAEEPEPRARAVALGVGLAVAASVLAFGFASTTYRPSPGASVLAVVAERERATLALLAAVIGGVLVFALVGRPRGNPAPPRDRRGTRRLALGLLVAVFVLATVSRAIFDARRADLRLAEGRRRADRGDAVEALAAVEAAVALQPREARHRLELARVCQQLAVDARQAPEARQRALVRGAEQAREAVRLAPYDPDNALALGRILFAWGELADRARLADARVALERAVRLAPGRVHVHELLARVLIAQGDDAAAIERLRLSAEIDARYPPTWLLLADVYNAHSEDARATDTYLRALELRVRDADGVKLFADPGLLERRVACFFRVGRVADLRRALLLGGASEETLATLDVHATGG